MGEIRNFRSGSHDEPPHGAMPRRLAAIIVGDIASYSRLMQADEEGTHVRVKRIERDLIQPTIVEHHGSLVKTTGDGFIAIFDSPVEAVRCSIVIQQNLIGRNASLPKHSRIEYRIGVNLGDVIVEPDDIYGDGVNIATRIEGIAEPGQVYISGAIYEQIKHKVVCGYEALGDHKVKNITDPVRIYRVLPDADAVGRTRSRRENALMFLLAIMVLVIAAGVLWYLLTQPGRVGEQAATPTASPAASPSPQPSPREATTQTPQPSPSLASSPAPASATPFREPQMVAIRGGSFAMGSNDDPTERPVHQVSVKPFSIGKYPVTVQEWNECAAAKACGFTAAGNDDAPVANVSWTDAQQYAAWLAQAAKKAYRLPSEAEWEYAARGGTQTKYWWGDKLQPGMAGCKDCGDLAAEQPGKVGSFKPNPFGLYDMGGGVDQWVEDCWHRTYQGAPGDGTAWTGGDCASHVLRSGSWKNDSRYVRPSNRDGYDTNVRYPTHGFRVALSP
ncbi:MULTISPECIES: SUMF1/EgtB/PvdO family nonheme iron enzyme [unclassified Bradyrhizobium]|uniref:SUMF1/EgtB/PvdO family nonheme iron enzyme n=1 Tax=unclassified Bradyrhizobium TaxID=2631580 RepID=UPI00247A80B6|nr:MULTISPECIES: SUMF1/EgtB/PvdO family nonheme iron enzyme [unclassified Bradyrhizobium]WGR69971.1 SUMF1/EgtB/PvdO family nonheme iron enzyme [Bradyrhizobium sp. ISRA426]WGR82028.1 SUMF1/EgtB/PvdO family nonheme iron enzyme [Bradyrhizobium sp. ISRA430]WGR85214.1 SUMF1/EgtB/PvdO family nonheme iron enzyme [Bradyrhizobium sp. ISRA432]